MQSPRSALATVFIAVFIYLLGFGIVIPLIPILSRQFGATPVETGLLMSIYSLMQFLFAPFWGRVSDRHGRRPVLMASMLFEGLCYIGFAFAPNLWWLFVARALSGFFGASISTASAVISDVTPANERSKGMALIGVAFGLGFVFGPALGGTLASMAQGWSSDPSFPHLVIGLFVAALCWANFLYMWKALPETRELRGKDKEPIGTTHKHKWLSLIRNLQKPQVGALLLISFILSFAMSSMEATLILYMNDLFKWEMKEVSYGFAYIGLVMIFSQGYLVRKVLPKIGERKIIPIGILLFAASLTLIGFSTTLPLMAVAMTGLALAQGLTNPAILGSVSLLTPSHEQGETLGVNQSLASLGRIVGPALGGWFYQTVSWGSPFFFSGVLGFIGLALILKIRAGLPNSGLKKATVDV